jgi:hypothetical protein
VIKILKSQKIEIKKVFLVVLASIAYFPINYKFAHHDSLMWIWNSSNAFDCPNSPQFFSQLIIIRPGQAFMNCFIDSKVQNFSDVRIIRFMTLGILLLIIIELEKNLKKYKMKFNSIISYTALILPGFYFLVFNAALPVMCAFYASLVAAKLLQKNNFFTFLLTLFSFSIYPSATTMMFAYQSILLLKGRHRCAFKNIFKAILLILLSALLTDFINKYILNFYETYNYSREKDGYNFIQGFSDFPSILIYRSKILFVESFNYFGTIKEFLLILFLILISTAMLLKKIKLISVFGIIIILLLCFGPMLISVGFFHHSRNLIACQLIIIIVTYLVLEKFIKINLMIPTLLLLILALNMGGIGYEAARNEVKAINLVKENLLGGRGGDIDTSFLQVLKKPKRFNWLIYNTIFYEQNIPILNQVLEREI